MHINTFKQFLNETDEAHKYGCVMAYFDIDQWNDILKMIDPKDLDKGEKSLEKESHVTLLYGLHNDIDHKKVIEKIRQFPNFSIYLNEISLFENENDVVKFEVQNDVLNYMNKELLKFPNSNKFPTYKAHMTISYCKKGTGKKYVGTIEPIRLTCTYYVYSLADGTKHRINI